MPHANGDETLGELADRMILECAMWRERAMRLEVTDEERAALHWFAHYGLPEHRAATLRGLLERLA